MEDYKTPQVSASASFRDSDIEFLQIQAREWLEAILREKLDEAQSLADLLADGSVLYRVSQIIREFMQRKKSGIDNNNNNKTTPTKMMMMSPEGSSSKGSKNNMKYLPYSYAETFLKLCRDIGLVDVDIFNAPDAIDKKDIRRVCMCICRLSKEARSHHLPVPDFNLFKSQAYNSTTPQKLAMSTDPVGGLRESLHKSSSKIQTDVPQAPEERSTGFAEIGFCETNEKAEIDQDVIVMSSQSPSLLEGAVEVGSGSETGKPVVHCDTAEQFMIIPDRKFKNKALDVSSKSQEQKTGKAVKSSLQWLAWWPMVGGLVVFLGTLLSVQMQNNRQVYEVKEGDTLAFISRHISKSSWQEELVHRNPNIGNPDLVYPSECLKL
jgi:hypothetical protein